MEHRHDGLSEDQARSLWSRAAELQERARREAEHAVGETAPAVDNEPGEEPAVSLDIAREAAVQSGIDGRYVDQALRQMRVERQLDSRASAARWARALRETDGTLNERMHLEVPPSEVKAAGVGRSTTTFARCPT